MTTAPTPEEVHALAARLEHCVAKWGKQSALSLEAYSAVKMMRRLQASYQALQTESERLRMELAAEARVAAEQQMRADQLAQQHRMQAQMHAQATRQLAELEASKNARIHKLEMDALDLASENSILKRAEADELEARKPLPLSDEQIDAIADGMPGGLGGFMKTWGWRQFARKILDLRAPPTWEPQFDAMAPGQEELAVQFCAEIAGPRGQPGSNPDPVRLLEMAEALYKAEADARLVDKSPNLQEPLVDKTENLQDRPTRKPLPPMEAVKLGMEAQQACRPHSTGTTNWADAMTRFYERRLCGITGGSS